MVGQGVFNGQQPVSGSRARRSKRFFLAENIAGVIDLPALFMPGLLKGIEAQFFGFKVNLRKLLEIVVPFHNHSNS